MRNRLAEALEILRDAAPEAAQTIVGVMRDGDATASERLSSAVALLERVAEPGRADIPGPGVSVVYVMQATWGGPVKIGFSTDLAGRLDALQGGYPWTLCVRRWFTGTFEDERELHQRLDVYRMRGEWFEDTEEVWRVVDRRALR
jgi:hypothetical protein